MTPPRVLDQRAHALGGPIEFEDTERRARDKRALVLGIGLAFGVGVVGTAQVGVFGENDARPILPERRQPQVATLEAGLGVEVKPGRILDRGGCVAQTAPFVFQLAIVQPAGGEHSLNESRLQIGRPIGLEPAQSVASAILSPPIPGHREVPVEARLDLPSDVAPDIVGDRGRVQGGARGEHGVHPRLALDVEIGGSRRECQTENRQCTARQGCNQLSKSRSRGRGRGPDW